MDSSEVKNNESVAKKSPFEELNREELISKCKGLLLIAQRAKQAKSEYQNEVDKFKAQIQIYESDIKAKDDNIQTLQELVDSLTEQKLTFITEIDTAQGKIRNIDKKCNQYEEQISKLKSDLILKDKNLATASQKLSDFDNEIISLKRQNKRLLEENEQLITQLTELEVRTDEFNKIAIQQREQLKILEQKVQNDDTYQSKIEELTKKTNESEATINFKEGNKNTHIKNYEDKIDELTKLYETEKAKKEKANIKLRSYKDKILKCANCINQLKNSRFILTKTVKEYSENIPKWQNEIIKASKALEEQMKDLNDININLKAELQEKEIELKDLSLSLSKADILIDQVAQLRDDNKQLNSQISDLKLKISESNRANNDFKNEISDLKTKEVNSAQLIGITNENKLLKERIDNLVIELNSVTANSNVLEIKIKELKVENSNLSHVIQSNQQQNQSHEKLLLQLKALESEKDILVKEKLNAKESVLELETQKKIINDQKEKIKIELEKLKTELDRSLEENKLLKESYKLEKDDMISVLKKDVISLKEQYDNLKTKYDNTQDLNGLLQEEVETLKLSLEQPKDDNENLSDINVSLQADIVKLETKLSAYKQENASLLSEIKETRIKVKDFDNLAAECEDAKAKLTGYKTENSELLNEMKEINQVLKERGEAISKLQKAVSEMERLIETLEKDRDVIKEENSNLKKQVELLENDLKSAESTKTKNNEEVKKYITERDHATRSIQEKEAVISGLKDELEKLRQQSSSAAVVDLPNEDMSTSTISKAEEHSRMKDLDETFEDKYTKLRLFALKLKKKLNETAAQLQSSEQEKSALKKLVDGDLEIKKQQLISRDEPDTIQHDEKVLNNKDISDLEVKVKTLVADLDASKKSIAKLDVLEAELAKKSQELTAEIDAHKKTKEQLEKALKDVKKKNVLSLEMEDYERSMKELTTKMEENKKKIVQMESTIDTQEGTITAMKTQIKLLEEQIKSEETQNRLLKEELQQIIEEGKEKDNKINAKKDTITKLMQDLEDEKRKNEEADLEMTLLLSEKEKIIMSFGEERAELNNKIKKFEFKCADLNEKLRITNIELADLKTEYTSYKVRAQAVLRQNQTVDHSQEEQLKEEAAALKAQLETLTQKYTALQDRCSELTSEVESSRKRAAEANAEAARAQQRTARLHTDLTRLTQQFDNETTQHKLQVSTLTQCYKTQISELESKLQKETESLKKQLAVLQENVKSGKSADELNRDKFMLPVIPKDDGSDSELDINVSLIPREEGEGSESAPSPPLSKSVLSGGRRSPVPLERLLEEGVPDDEALDTSSLGLTPEQEIADLRRKVQGQQQRLKHITVLLSESERECARRAQLSELLKAELRRVRGAAHHAHNTEYMKNVTFKFLTLPPGDERSRLVPVLQKILTLSSDETHKIQAIAKGQDKGWGSYLPWPGGK